MTQAIKFWKDRAKRAESTLMAVTDDLKRAEATNEDLLEALEAALAYIEKTETRPGKGAIRTSCVAAITRAEVTS